MDDSRLVWGGKVRVAGGLVRLTQNEAGTTTATLDPDCHAAGVTSVEVIDGNVAVTVTPERLTLVTATATPTAPATIGLTHDGGTFTITTDASPGMGLWFTATYTQGAP